jgi:1,4-alpha-glucan branching enzyme
VRQPIGTCCVVLHTHLPWVAHAGAWPVGEEWLHQAFTGSWRRVLAVLDRLAARGGRDVVTLGITPVAAGMLDDPYCLAELHAWAGAWQLRAEELARRPDPALRSLATHEFRAATDCLADIEGRWRTGGGSSVLRPLADSGVIELLGGPVAHPFAPLLRPRVRRLQLRTGLDDARLRLGAAPAGIWAPECAYAPGMEQEYAAAGVQRFVVDGPALQGVTSAARPVGDSGVLAFGRDLDVTYRVWSPRSGYPGDPRYRDFHTYDHASGFRPARVTGKNVPPEQKRPWDPAAASAAVAEHVEDFVGTVLRRLRALRERDGRPGMVLVAYDTELFGHWWYEGPEWLHGVLLRLPEEGVYLTTLRGAAEHGHVGAAIDLPASTWGSGKDYRVWSNDQVADLVAHNSAIEDRLQGCVDRHRGRARDPRLDQLAREACLALASDWAFMVSKDSAASYARERAAVHAARFDRLADLIDRADPEAGPLAETLRQVDGLAGHLDARLL